MEGEDSQRCRKRKECGVDDEGWYLKKILAISDDEDDDCDVENFQISEEAVVEMMRWLEHEICLGSSPSPSPSQEATFVTINGNDENCGPSFSGPASTVMASIDTRGAAGSSCFVGDPSGLAPMFCSWPLSFVEDGGQRPTPAGATAADEEEEEEWLARVLDGPLLVELEEGLV